MSEMTDEQVFGKGGPQKEMTDEEVFGRSLQPPTAGEAIPEAFLDRVRAGQALGRIFQEGAKSAGEGFGTPTPTGFEDETLGHLIDTGIFHDPLKGRASPVQFATEALMMPAAKAWDAITRSVNAGIHGAGGAMGQLVEEFGGSQGTANRAKNEVINAGNWAMIEGGMGRFSRPAATPEGVMDQTIGGLPKPEDFTNVAKVLAPREAPIAQFRRDAVEINAALAPVAEGEVRLWRGNRLGEVGQNPHFTNSLEGIALPFREGYGGPLSYVDVPAADLAKYTDTGTVAAGAELTLPPDLAAKAKVVAVGRGPTAADIVEQNLRRMWQEDGIHPAEAVHDAQTDAFVKNEIVAPRVNIELGPERIWYQGVWHGAGEKPASDYWTTDINLAREYSGPGGHVFAARESAFPEDAISSVTGKVLSNKKVTPGKPYSIPDIETLGKLSRNASDDEFIALAGEVKYGIPKEDYDALTETGGKPGSLSAAITPPEEIPIDVQPASPPGRLAAAFKDAADTLLDIGRDAQMLTAPMATGTRDSMAMAKDFANSLRRNRWDWSRIDTDIAKRFDPESRARMWNAADEESLSLKLGEPAAMREHQGLATLNPEERALVDQMQTRAQNAWVRARDIGMVEGEGLPSYAPRMIINVAGAGAKETALALDGIGGNLRTKTGNLLKRKYLEAQETEAAAKKKYGDQAMLARDIRVLPLATSQLEDAVAGRTLINNIKDYGAKTGAETVVEGAIPAGSDTKWFTLDHPAFRTWRPKLDRVEGKLQGVKDAEGKTIFEQVPIYVHGDFEGPLRAVLSQKSGALYGGMMSLKGKTMSLIMNSPMIHNAVEWGRALPAMPGKVASFKVYFEGNRAKNNVPLMHEAIDNGLVPIGHRFFNQDISGLMESPDLTPGRSWTAQLAGFVPGLFDPAAGAAVKTAIDKAGNFWHNTLLWDRVADLQMGLYTNFRADAIAKGIDQQTASRMAAHFANRYAGALPKEAMSDAATKISNMLMFSRSFTMGNLGVIKDMFTGLPKDVLAQIERDAGFAKGSIEGADADFLSSEIGGEKAKQPVGDAVKLAKSMARRKAMAVVGMDMALLYVGNSLLQNAMNVMVNDSTLEKEFHGYAERFRAKLQAIKEHPLELIQTLRLLQDLSSTSENEPGKGERIHVGNAANGTAIYMRNPAGKIGEEFVGYMTGPLDMMRRKLGTIARPAWQIMSNDKGFGRKIYDPDADTPGKYLANLGKIAAHIAGSQLPEGQIGAFSDLVKGEGDAKVNALQALGPFAGVTFAKGAPGGMQVGEMYANKSQFEFRVNQAMPDIRRQIQRGDIPGATQRMTELGMDPSYQRWVTKTTLNPATRIGPKAMRDFYRTATPEQRARFERAQQAPPAPQAPPAVTGPPQKDPSLIMNGPQAGMGIRG